MEACGRNRAVRRRVAVCGHHFDPMQPWPRLGTQDCVGFARNGLVLAVEKDGEALSLALFQPHPQWNVRYELHRLILGRVDDPHGATARRTEQARHQRSHTGTLESPSFHAYDRLALPSVKETPRPTTTIEGRMNGDRHEV